MSNLEEFLEDGSLFCVLAADCRLAKVPVGNSGGEVGTHQHRHWDPEYVVDGVGEELDAAGGEDVESLDEGDADGALLHLALERRKSARDELVGDHKDEDVGVGGGLNHVRHWIRLLRLGLNSSTLCIISVPALTFSGSFFPLRYLTFSCLVLMISLSFCPSTSSSNTHMRTSSANWPGLDLALAPTSMEMAEPQLPDPTMHTLLGEEDISRRLWTLSELSVTSAEAKGARLTAVAAERRRARWSSRGNKNVK